MVLSNIIPLNAGTKCYFLWTCLKNAILAESLAVEGLDKMLALFFLPFVKAYSVREFRGFWV